MFVNHDKKSATYEQNRYVYQCQSSWNFVNQAVNLCKKYENII